MQTMLEWIKEQGYDILFRRCIVSRRDDDFENQTIRYITTMRSAIMNGTGKEVMLNDANLWPIQPNPT